jgi:hypothetical protein
MLADGMVHPKTEQDANRSDMPSKRAEQNGTSFGRRVFRRGPFSYLTHLIDQITLTKRPYTVSDLINIFSAAGS